MEDEMFSDIESRLIEFSNKIFIDYERESILLEVRKDYLDEVVKIKTDILTILACVPQIIDVYNE